MSNRNDILEGIKDCLANITTINGFNLTVTDVVRKFVFFDQIASFPYLIVLGGNEELEDNLGDHTVSKLSVRVMGYAKNTQEPEVEQCKLISDVLSCLNSDTYNAQKSHMRPVGIETDEGMLHAEGEGLSIFVMNLELIYRFQRSSP
jgi:hypothetical protein